MNRSQRLCEESPRMREQNDDGQPITQPEVRETPQSKIIQIINNNNADDLIVLCEDGSLWNSYLGGNREWKWSCIYQPKPIKCGYLVEPAKLAVAITTNLNWRIFKVLPNILGLQPAWKTLQIREGSYEWRAIGEQIDHWESYDFRLVYDYIHESNKDEGYKPTTFRTFIDTMGTGTLGRAQEWARVKRRHTEQQEF